MGTNNKNKGLVAVDIDGLIAWRTAKRRYDFENFKPIKGAIVKVNRLYRKGYIIIYYTARPLRYYEKTYNWLVKSNCEFHALRMGKMRADFYLDDHNEKLDNL